MYYPWRYFFIIFCITYSIGQLPTDVKLNAFYDHNTVNFDGFEPIDIHEVPGMPLHFLVLDMKGYWHTLYPKSGDITTGNYPSKSFNYRGEDLTVIDYERTQLADFHTRVPFHFQTEVGMTAFAFHPEFPQKPYVYVIGREMYQGQQTIDLGSWETVEAYHILEEWEMTDAFTKISRKRVIFKIYHTDAFGVDHVDFGPDGYLYAALMDYGTNGTDWTDMRRKIIRIDINKTENGKEYGIPADNPFVSNPDTAVKKEIWAGGFRNAWNFGWDLATGNMWSGDVGQSFGEELNLIVKGGNYGWILGGDGQGGNGGTNGNGPRGPCDANQYDCTNVIDPVQWIKYGRRESPPDDVYMQAIGVGVSYMGEDNSVFKDHFFVFDHGNDEISAITGDGSTIKVVGNAKNVSGIPNQDGHVGMARMSNDYMGNIYVTVVGRDQDFQIYKMDHSQLIPKSYPKFGCTNSSAPNFDQTAVIDDGSCQLNIKTFPKNKDLFEINSFTNGITIHSTLPISGSYFLKIKDVKGRVVSENIGNAQGKHLELNLEFPIINGVYFITLTNNGNRLTQKVFSNP